MKACKKKDNCKWLIREILDEKLNEKEIRNIINKKLAYIIIELENNSLTYLNKK